MMAMSSGDRFTASVFLALTCQKINPAEKRTAMTAAISDKLADQVAASKREVA